MQEEFLRACFQMGYIEPKDIQKCREIQRDYQQRQQAVSIEKILVDQEFITLEDITKIRDYVHELSNTKMEHSSIVKAEPISQQFGRYTIISELGSGGMGKVYKAYDNQLQREVALKTLHSQDFNALQRFAREAKAMGKLSHPNIIPIYDVGKFNNSYYLTMKLIPGQSLSELSRKSKLTIRKTVEIMQKVALAIAYAHKQTIIHRDLKPSNVMIDEEGIPHVMDFGLARADDDIELSQTGMPMGTISYMSPEQVVGKRKTIDAQSDVYSLGVMLYELLSGKLPFVGNNSHAVLLKITDSEALPPSSISKRIPKELDNICLKAIAKNKKQRYKNAIEFANDLQRFLDGESVLAKTVKTKTLGKFLLRNVWNLLVVLLIVTITYFALHLLRPQKFKNLEQQLQQQNLLLEEQNSKITKMDRSIFVLQQNLRTQEEASQGKIAPFLRLEKMLNNAESCIREKNYVLAYAQYLEMQRSTLSPQNHGFIIKQLAYIFPRLPKLQPMDWLGEVSTFATNHDGKIATANDKTLKIWDLKQNLLSEEIFFTIEHLKFDPNNNLFVIGDRELMVLDQNQQKILEHDFGKDLLSHSVAMNKNSCYGILYENDKTVRKKYAFADKSLTSENNTLGFDKELSIATHPNSESNILFIGYESGIIKIFDEQIKKYDAKKLHSNSVNIILSSKDGLISMEKQGTIRIWDFKENYAPELFGVLYHPGIIEWGTQNPDFLACGAKDSKASIWYRKTWQKREVLDQAFGNKVVSFLSPDHALLLQENKVYKYQLISKIHSASKLGKIVSVCFAIDDHLAFASDVLNDLSVWDYKENKILDIKTLETASISSILHDKGSFYTTLNNKKLAFFSLEAENGAQKIETIAKYIFQKHKTLILCSPSKYSNKIIKFDIETKDVIEEISLKDKKANCFAYSDSQGMIVGTKNGEICAVNSENILYTTDFSIDAIDCCNIKDYLGFVDKNKITLWDLKRTQKLYSIKQKFQVTVIRFSENGEFFAVGDTQGNITIYNTDTGRFMEYFKGHAGEVTCLDIISGKIASGGADGQVFLWDISKDEEIIDFAKAREKFEKLFDEQVRNNLDYIKAERE